MDRFAIKMMVLLVVAGSLPPLGSGQAAPAKPPTIIGHRGAPGYLPEHTLEGYSLAIDQGADFIEPDLVISRDGVLFARHENEISGTTDVAKKFPGRRGSKKVDGRMRFGWFLEDFTAAEVGTLRARERLSFRDQSKNGLYGIPTFREIITLVQKKSRKLGRKIGIYPELKHSTYFRGIGLPLEEPLVGILRETGLDHPQAPIFIQSFEVSNLRALKTMTRAPLIQLIGRPGRRPYDFIARGDARTYGDLIGPEGLKEIAGYARGIGARKQLLLSTSLTDPGVPEGATDDTLVKRAHRAGLLVHAYTFRNEPRYIAVGIGIDPTREYLHFFRMGVDGVFSDFPDTAVAARAKFMAGK